MNGKEESRGGRGRLGLRKDRDGTAEGSGNSCNMHQFGIMTSQIHVQYYNNWKSCSTQQGRR